MNTQDIKNWVFGSFRPVNCQEGKEQKHQFPINKSEKVKSDKKSFLFTAKHAYIIFYKIYIRSKGYMSLCMEYLFK